MRATLGLIAGLLFCVGDVAGIARVAVAASDRPTITPARGGAGVPLVYGHFEDLDAIGYETTEFFISGNAHSYTSTAPLTADGKWNAVAPDPTTAAYTTRVVVHTPKHAGPVGDLARHGSPRQVGPIRRLENAGRFNGTVYVEWFNVTGLADASPDWVHAHLQIAREGAIYVGVSAQAAGVNQLQVGGPLPDTPGDPVRYAPLVHPGDSYSYDIFSQVGQAIRDGRLLGGLVPRRVIAMGESQSAGRMVTYIDAVHPLADVYDGFLVHSRGKGGAALSQDPLPSIPVEQADIRDDLDVPVIVFQTETDVGNSTLLARQPETRRGNFRLWEVAGTAHFDVYGLNLGLTDIGDGNGEVEALAALQNAPSIPMPGLIECARPINAGPMHWVFNAAVHWINLWVKDGTPPPIAPRLEATSAPGVEPVVFAVDAYGDAVGVIRTPFVDAPIAMLAGNGNGARPPAFPGEVVPPTSRFCAIFGQTVPFTDAELAASYPDHETFASEYSLAAMAAVRSGFLLPPDARALRRAAALSDIGG